jgi:hypothetical protein
MEKYAYERLEMALHDHAPMRTMASELRTFSGGGWPLGDSPATVRVLRDETGLVTVIGRSDFKFATTTIVLTSWLLGWSPPS